MCVPIDLADKKSGRMFCFAESGGHFEMLVSVRRFAPSLLIWLTAALLPIPLLQGGPPARNLILSGPRTAVVAFVKGAPPPARKAKGSNAASSSKAERAAADADTTQNSPPPTAVGALAEPAAKELLVDVRGLLPAAKRAA